MVCTAWLGIRLFPPSIRDLQVGNLKRALLQERLVVCITVQVVQGSNKCKGCFWPRKGFKCECASDEERPSKRASSYGELVLIALTLSSPPRLLHSNHDLQGRFDFMYTPRHERRTWKSYFYQSLWNCVYRTSACEALDQWLHVACLDRILKIRARYTCKSAR